MRGSGIRWRFEEWLTEKVDESFPNPNADLTLNAPTPMSVPHPELMRWAFLFWDALKDRVMRWTVAMHLLDVWDENIQAEGHEMMLQAKSAVEDSCFKEDEKQPDDDGYRSAEDLTEDEGKERRARSRQGDYAGHPSLQTNCSSGHYRSGSWRYRFFCACYEWGLRSVRKRCEADAAGSAAINFSIAQRGICLSLTIKGIIYFYRSRQKGIIFER